jgi:hypothetical protein
MNQPSLFDNDRPPRLHRRTDPATSAEGAKVAAITAGTARERMFAAIRYLEKHHEYPTANEAAARCVTLHGGERETYRKRADELVRSGEIEIGGSRACQQTGKRATTYRVRIHYRTEKMR